MLKAGPDGCYFQGAGGPVRLPSAATVVVDPVGAGDAFAGGYLAARLCDVAPGGEGLTLIPEPTTRVLEHLPEP